MNLNLCYWEQKDEEKYRTALNPSSQASKSSLGSAHAMSSSPSSSKPKFSPAKLQSPSPMAASSSSKAKKPNLSKVLGLDGKLLPEEKDHHKRLSLCIIALQKTTCQTSAHHARMPKDVPCNWTPSLRMEALSLKLSLQIPQTEDSPR